MQTIHEAINAADGARAVVEQTPGGMFRLTIWDTDAGQPVGSQFFPDTPEGKAKAIATADKINEAT